MGPHRYEHIHICTYTCTYMCIPYTRQVHTHTVQVHVYICCVSTSMYVYRVYVHVRICIYQTFGKAAAGWRGVSRRVSRAHLASRTPQLSSYMHGVYTYIRIYMFICIYVYTYTYVYIRTIIHKTINRTQRGGAASRDACLAPVSRLQLAWRIHVYTFVYEFIHVCM